MRLKMPYDEDLFRNMNRNDMMKLTKNNDYQNVNKYFTKKDLDQMPLEELKRLFYWSSNDKKIKNVCEELKLWFQNNEALLYI